MVRRLLVGGPAAGRLPAGTRRGTLAGLRSTAESDRPGGDRPGGRWPGEVERLPVRGSGLTGMGTRPGRSGTRSRSGGRCLRSRSPSSSADGEGDPASVQRPARRSTWCSAGRHAPGTSPAVVRALVAGRRTAAGTGPSGWDGSVARRYRSSSLTQMPNGTLADLEPVPAQPFHQRSEQRVPGAGPGDRSARPAPSAAEMCLMGRRAGVGGQRSRAAGRCPGPGRVVGDEPDQRAHLGRGVPTRRCAAAPDDCPLGGEPGGDAGPDREPTSCPACRGRHRDARGSQADPAGSRIADHPRRSGETGPGCLASQDRGNRAGPRPTTRIASGAAADVGRLPARGLRLSPARRPRRPGATSQAWRRQHPGRGGRPRHRGQGEHVTGRDLHRELGAGQQADPGGDVNRSRRGGR